jgi:riboflavin kinase / FMN adenylyltransferase
VRVARSPDELPPARRAAAIGTFDGVHLGHRAVLDAAQATGLTPIAVTFDPHPRTVVGDGVELLTTVERRLELLAEAGMEEALVVRFDRELAGLPPEEFAQRYLLAIGVEAVAAGAGFRFGHRRSGDLEVLERLGLDVLPVPLVDGASSTAIRDFLRVGEVERAARALGRAPELDGVVVTGDARGAGLGFPTANLELDPAVLVPAHGIYAGAALGRPAAISLGTNPHYGGAEQRIEAFLLDYEGDLYGRRLVVELWQRLRDERAFASEEELVAQIAQDVELTRAARRPV